MRGFHVFNMQGITLADLGIDPDKVDHDLYWETRSWRDVRFECRGMSITVDTKHDLVFIQSGHCF